MKAEHQPTSSDMDGASAWLDGLAGRSGHGPAHEEGAALRDALHPKASEPAPSWADIERRAGLAPMGDGEPSLRIEGPGRKAANASSWMPWLGAAAAVLLVVGIGLSIVPSDPAEGLRGGGSAEPLSTATWRVADPVGASRELAAELESLGARVEWRAADRGAQLAISASGAAAVAAVNQRLLGLETALDASGRLTLMITEP